MNRRERCGRRTALKLMIALLGVFGLQQTSAHLPGPIGPVNAPPFVARPFVQAIVIPEDFAGIETRDLWDADLSNAFPMAPPYEA
ncbi:MAG: hypothetical protein O7H39_06780, partial [Gammaproteobacteria bacterium]|nr:hypothetical protein [Gammaproteobacteria bacterium]